MAVTPSKCSDKGSNLGHVGKDACDGLLQGLVNGLGTVVDLQHLLGVRFPECTCDASPHSSAFRTAPSIPRRPRPCGHWSGTAAN